MQKLIVPLAYLVGIKVKLMIMCYHYDTRSTFIVTDSLGLILEDYRTHFFCDDVLHSTDAENLAQLCCTASRPLGHPHLPTVE